MNKYAWCIQENCWNKIKTINFFTSSTKEIINLSKLMKIRLLWKFQPHLSFSREFSLRGNDKNKFKIEIIK